MPSKTKLTFLSIPRKSLICLLIPVSILFAGCDSVLDAEREVSRTVALMGTFVQIKAVSKDLSKEDLLATVNAVLASAEKIENMMSVYNPESELNKLNFSGKASVSRDLMEVLLAAERINVLTSGAFDPTISPILKRNGFYKDMPGNILDAIPDTDAAVGFHNVHIDQTSGMVKLENGAWLDLSGIAKGYIVDRISAELKASGIETFLVNAGGDIYCAKGPSGKKWRIGIRRPGTENISEVLEMEFYAVATSGDYENVVVEQEDLKTMSHIADPKTFLAMEMMPLGFTVIAPDCVTADGLATGMIVMGAEKAVEIADNIDGVEVIAIMSPSGEDAVLFSSGAKDYISKEVIK